MGQGIAQIAIQNGLSVVLYDMAAGAAASARGSVLQRLDRIAAKGQADVSGAPERLRAIASYAEFSNCDVVIEAVVERLDAKRAVFIDLENVVRDDAILASNTSSLSIGEIARVCRHRDRIAGMHF